ncbi:MAG TPA: TonB-dependent receptor plug domain-containing protein [Opitutaceae bacterium]|nr:TonB-dependent receptor plug domain-containing protein [Opitutaceae bacterium]
MTPRKYRTARRTARAWLTAVLATTTAIAQTRSPGSPEKEDDLIVLTPFEVSASSNENGYATAATLAGNRLNTELKDLGSSISIYNSQFLKDIGATDNQSLLQYTLGTEVGGLKGNYSGSGGGTSPNTDTYLSPESTNRVRGLVSADNTRDLYLSSIPWDGYNIDAVDLQRGPNAILFGQGSPGGVINTRTKQATYRNLGEVSVRVDQYGSVRGTVDLNRVILKDELSVRFDAVQNASKFRQDPAFEHFHREYLALRWEPKFLKIGGARTIIKVDGEIGHSTSNRPRNMPPGDHITPWFTALNQKLYNPAWANDGNLTIPGRGDAAKTDINSNPNPNYEPWIGATNFGNNYYGGPELFFLPGSTSPVVSLVLNPNAYRGIDSKGVRDGTIGGLPPAQPHGIAGYRDWAVATNQPFSTLAKNTYITDPSIFDFYNNLIDGDIKREWSHFRAHDASLSQTFFHDTMGFDLGYHDESYTGGSYSPLLGDGGSIFIDYNTVWPDGTNTPETGWYTDGTANPGAGRPFVQLGNGRGETTTDRTSVRFTAFVSHEFDRNNKKNWILRFLGKQTLTGLASRDTYKSYSHNWADYGVVGDYYTNDMFDAVKAANGRFWPDFNPIRTVYLGDSLVGKKLGQDLGIHSPGSDPSLGDTITLRYFDSHWNAPNVDPSAPWYNQVTAGSAGGPALSTQSENPANYVGWVTKQVPLLRANTQANQDLLTSRRNWDDRANNALALVWQGKFWDNSIVATAGARRDKVSQVLTVWDAQNSSDRASSDPTLVIPQVSTTGPFSKNSTSWGVVAHFNNMPLLSRLMKHLPLEISASYNRSENFQTGQVYHDYFGQPLPLPKGSTKDMGLIFETKDSRYSLRINKFESSVQNDVSTGLQFWNYGNNVGIYAQAYSQIKYNYEVRSNPSSPRHGDGIISDLPVPTNSNPNMKWTFDYQPTAGQTLEQAQQQEIAVINAWDQWLKEMDPLPIVMGKAWGFDWANDLTESGLADFRFTQDLLAKGHEIELNAQITDSWRLTVNASRIKSFVSNIGQTPAPGGKMTVMDYMLDFDRRMNETAMGDLRIWGGGAGGTTARQNWDGYADGDLKARLAEQGTVVPENRLWHVNVVSNYDFKHGMLTGWSIGGAARYQSSSILAYKPIQNSNYISYDLGSPYRDSAEINFDAWVGYSRKLFNNKVLWRAQLNIQNIGVGNELVPVTVQPDGTPAAYRIRPPQELFLTNTFSF